jgi:hypothetical protein
MLVSICTALEDSEAEVFQDLLPEKYKLLEYEQPIIVSAMPYNIQPDAILETQYSQRRQQTHDPRKGNSSPCGALVPSAPSLSGVLIPSGV